MSPGRRRGRPPSHGTRQRIVEAALRLFAERGYTGTHTEDIARELSLSKATIFQHFRSKEGLFLAVYKKAVSSFPSWLDAPAAVRRKGFFATLRYWLDATEHMIREHWMEVRVTMLGSYGTDLNLRRQINHYKAAEDPYGTFAFVRFGLERGELRKDVASEMLISILESTFERFQDALLAEELDPGLFCRHVKTPERAQARIDQYILVLRGAIGDGENQTVRSASSNRP